MGVGPLSIDESVKAAIEVLKILAWPAAVAWIIWYLRAEVKDAAKRITALELTGAKFAAPPTQQTLATSPTEVLAAAASTAPQPGPTSSSAQQVIERIKAIVTPDQLDPAVQKIRRELLSSIDPQAQTDVLTHGLASLNIQLQHERNYRAIFGSQLTLLGAMNTDAGVPPSTARQIYDVTKSKYPEVYQTYSFDQWIGFLLNGGLVAVAPNGNYVLTSYGRGLLQYILQQHLATSKEF